MVPGVNVPGSVRYRLDAVGGGESRAWHHSPPSSILMKLGQASIKDALVRRGPLPSGTATPQESGVLPLLGVLRQVNVGLFYSSSG